MSLDLKIEYPAQVGTATAEYPFGLPRNVSLPGAGDGTPWEEELVKDIFGFLAKVLGDAGITPSGTPDTALASQYLEALQLLFLNRAELRPAGNILIEGDRMAVGARDGLQITWNTETLFSISEGEARTSENTTDLVLPASVSKNPTLTWAPGNGQGALPESLPPTNLWYRVFQVGKPDGSADICIDTSNSAANFFADSVAISNGFSDNTLRRRIGWVYLDAGLVMPEFIRRFDQPGRYVWDQPFNDAAITGVPSVSRQANVMEHAPPNSLALLNIGFGASQAGQIRISESLQADNTVSISNFTMIATGAGKSSSVRGHWLVDSARQIYVRHNGGGATNLDIMTEGWFDSGVFEP